MARVMICPMCDQPIDYVSKGAGHIMHRSPAFSHCFFALEVGQITKEQALAKWEELRLDVEDE